MPATQPRGAEPASLVGAIFTDRDQASAAAETLEQRGLAGRELVRSAVRSPEHHVVETRAVDRMMSALAAGGLVGAAGGAAAGIVIALAVDPAMTVWVALAGLIGAVAGGLVGTFTGLNRHRPGLWAEVAWADIPLEESEVLLVLPGGGNEAAILDTLAEHGGRSVEPRRSID